MLVFNKERLKEDYDICFYKACDYNSTKEIYDDIVGLHGLSCIDHDYLKEMLNLTMIYMLISKENQNEKLMKYIINKVAEDVDEKITDLNEWTERIEIVLLVCGRYFKIHYDKAKPSSYLDDDWGNSYFEEVVPIEKTIKIIDYIPKNNMEV